MKKNIKQGKYIVLKKNGKAHFAMKADKEMKVEAPDSFDVEEKELKYLSNDEKKALKEKKQKKLKK